MAKEADIAQELLRLRRNQIWLCCGLVAACVVCGAVMFRQHLRIDSLQTRDHLSLRRLDIIDAHGTSRVILAAPAPAPTLFRKTLRRDGPVSGILLADATGTERGGYVTGDGDEANALLTLDAQGRQTILMLAEQDGATLLRLWNGQRGSVVMGVAQNPFLNVNAMGTPLFTEPVDNSQSRSAKPLYR